MSAQTVTIQVDPSTAVILQTLKQQAAAQGVSLDSLLLPLAEALNGGNAERPFYETATPEEWVQAFREWAASHDPNIPPLSLADVSRDRLNEDRW